MKKGITLIMLGIMIAILTMLLTVVVINGDKLFNDAKKLKLQAEIEQIEVLIDNYIVRNSGNDFAKIELDISGYTETEKQQFVNENIVENKLELFVVELDKIDVHKVNYGDGKRGEIDRYLYSELTKKVYYEQGVKLDGEVYHRIDK